MKAIKKQAYRGAEFFGSLLEGAIYCGLISGAAVVAFFGKFYLSLVLLVVALLVFLRFKRGRVNSK